MLDLELFREGAPSDLIQLFLCVTVLLLLTGIERQCVAI